MPQKAEHLRQASKNEGFFESFHLDSTPYLDWVVTGVFYSALHYVDAYLASKSIDPRSHEERHAYVSREANLRFVEAEYLKLENQSRLARYECFRFRPGKVRELIDADFARLRDYIKGLM